MTTNPSIPEPAAASTTALRSRRVKVDGLSLFYREAGSPENPTLVLLHGYPSSSFMFRELMGKLADRFHLIAPDYPGFSNTDTPPPTEFAYTFDHLAEVTGRFLEALDLEKYSLYMQDYGAPVGFRLAAQHPERIKALVVQNGNAYEEGFSPAWARFRALWENRTPETEAGIAAFFAPQFTQFFYTEGILCSRDRTGSMATPSMPGRRSPVTARSRGSRSGSAGSPTQPSARSTPRFLSPSRPPPGSWPISDARWMR